MTFEVVVLGSANVDMVLQVDRYPSAGETIVAAHNQESAGGKGLNQAVAAARAGARTAFVGAVGTDAAGRSLLDTLRAEHVDATVVHEVDAPTGRAVVVVQPSGENTIFVVPGANSLLALDERADAVITSGRVLVAQMEIPVPIVSRAFHLARGAGVTTVLNAAPAVRPPDSLLDDVDVLIVNEHEAMLLGGATDPLEAAAALNVRVGETVVTLGAEGAAHLDRSGQVARVAGFPTVATDTTGAGDAFVGVLAAALAEGLPMASALQRAVAAGSLTVERAGAVSSIPHRAETDERLSGSGPDR